MTSQTRNVDILRDAYRQWNETKGRSVDHWFNAVIAETISFGSVPRGAAPLDFAKQYSGAEQLRAYFNGLAADWSMVYYKIDEFIADGDAVVARGSCAWTNKRTGKIAETPKVDFWRFKDGKAIEFYEYFDTACVAAAAA